MFEGYALTDRLIDLRRHGRGHIHDTFKVSTKARSGQKLYLLQRINQTVFRDPAALMHNIRLVTEHQRAFLRKNNHPDLDRRFLNLVPTAAGDSFYFDGNGQYWRIYQFITGTRTLNLAESPALAREAARAFAQFQAMLADLPPQDLNVTIPGFHHTAARFDKLMQAYEEDFCRRARLVAAEMDFVLVRRAKLSRLLDLERRGELPKRVIHNDTKLNNLLFAADSDEALCVIDLDTVMPGLAPYDFGDLARTVLSPLAEDDANPEGGGVRLPFFRALVRGFLEGGHGLLTPAEIAELPYSAWLITMENGIRFLTDFLQADRYFRISRPHQNLDRCRNQFFLATEIEKNLQAMQEIVEDCLLK